MGGHLASLLTSFLSGTQNYTCNATLGTYSPSGTAQAVLMDITQYYNNVTKPPQGEVPIQDEFPAGYHYYVPNFISGIGIVPMFRLIYGDVFVITSKINAVASSDPNYSVAWVILENVQFPEGGFLARYVVRVQTNGGVVPMNLNTCVEGQEIRVPYEAKYLFFE